MYQKMFKGLIELAYLKNHPDGLVKSEVLASLAVAYDTEEIKDDWYSESVTASLK